MYLARGAAPFWELGAPLAPPEAPRVIGWTPRLPSGWCGGFDGGLGSQRLSRAFHLRPCRRAGLSWARRRHRLWGHLRPTPRRPFPLLGTRGDRALSWGAILFIIHNNEGGDSLAPRCLRPLGGLRPPLGLRPLWGLDPPAGRRDHIILLLLVRQLIELVRVSPTLYLRDRSLRRIGRGEPRLLSLAVVLVSGFTALRLPRALRLLRLLSLLLLLVPGPILGPELLVLRDWGQGVLDDPHSLQKTSNRG